MIITPDHDGNYDPESDCCYISTDTDELRDIGAYINGNTCMFTTDPRFADTKLINEKIFCGVYKVMTYIMYIDDCYVLASSEKEAVQIAISARGPYTELNAEPDDDIDESLVVSQPNGSALPKVRSIKSWYSNHNVWIPEETMGSGIAHLYSNWVRPYKPIVVDASDEFNELFAPLN